MSTEANKALVRDFYEQVFNQRNTAIADQFLAATFVSYGLPGLPHGPDSAKVIVEVFTAAFPDFHITIDDIFGEGDKVVVWWTERMTHRGEWAGVAPTGKAVTLTGISIARIVDGKMVEGWGSHDDLGLLQQLGAVAI